MLHTLLASYATSLLLLTTWISYVVACAFQCGLQVAQRWAGVPNQELIKQAEAVPNGGNGGSGWVREFHHSTSEFLRSVATAEPKAAEQKARQIQRESLQDTGRKTVASWLELICKLISNDFCRDLSWFVVDFVVDFAQKKRWSQLKQDNKTTRPWTFKHSNIHFVIEKETSMLRQHIKRVERKCPPFDFFWLWCSLMFFDVLWCSCQRPDQLAGTKSYKAMLERCRRQCPPWPANWWRSGTAIATIALRHSLRSFRSFAVLAVLGTWSPGHVRCGAFATSWSRTKTFCGIPFAVTTVTSFFADSCPT